MLSILSLRQFFMGILVNDSNGFQPTEMPWNGAQAARTPSCSDKPNACVCVCVCVIRMNPQRVVVKWYEERTSASGCPNDRVVFSRTSVREQSRTVGLTNPVVLFLIRQFPIEWSWLDSNSSRSGTARKEFKTFDASLFQLTYGTLTDAQYN